MVSEKADAREVAEEYLPAVQAQAVQDWLNEESQQHNIAFHGLKGGGFDSYTYAWINMQLAKTQSSSSSSGSSQ
jgi:uncharacterized HAD superfamily protein